MSRFIFIIFSSCCVTWNLFVLLNQYILKCQFHFPHYGSVHYYTFLPGRGGDGRALLGRDNMDPTRKRYVPSPLSLSLSDSEGSALTLSLSLSDLESHASRMARSGAMGINSGVGVASDLIPVVRRGCWHR